MPRKTVIELGKLLADSDEEVKIEISATQASFAFGGVELVSKLVDGKFPDYTRVIPVGHKNKLPIGRDALRQSLMRAAILSNEKFRGVRWVLTDGSLKIVSSNTEQEEAEETIEVAYKGDALDIGFNVNYLLDVLNNVGGERRRVPVRRCGLQRADEFSDRSGIQVRRHADEDLGWQKRKSRRHGLHRTPPTTTRTASRS